jgi:hypothetical protein
VLLISRRDQIEETTSPRTPDANASVAVISRSMPPRSRARAAGIDGLSPNSSRSCRTG